MTIRDFQSKLQRLAISKLTPETIKYIEDTILWCESRPADAHTNTAKANALLRKIKSNVKSSPMSPSVKSDINSLFDVMQKPVTYSYGRWQDEKEYEDWNDYDKMLSTAFYKECAKAKFITSGLKVSQRPYGVTFIATDKTNDWKVTIKCTSKKYVWEAEAI